MCNNYFNNKMLFLLYEVSFSVSSVYFFRLVVAGLYKKSKIVNKILSQSLECELCLNIRRDVPI